MAKIKFSVAKELEVRITDLSTKLYEALKEADAIGLILSQHRCKGTLDRFEYFLTGVKIHVDDIEV